MTQTLAFFRRPFDWPGLCGFFAARAVPGVEAVGRDSYARTFILGGQAGSLSAMQTDGDALTAEIRFPDQASLPEIERRLRRLFDLDADPTVVNTHLARDPNLAPSIANNAGLRVPGAWDGFELAVRAILGQQVSVAAARNLAGRLVAAFGTPIAAPDTPGLDRLFPSPEQLRDADIALVLNMPRARGGAIRTLAAACLAEPDLLEPGQGLERAVARLTALPGIGAWSAHYIAMRALKEPDALPHGDIGLMRALDRGDGRPSPKALLAHAETWRPYRAYAAMHLWTGDAGSIGAAKAKR